MAAINIEKVLCRKIFWTPGRSKTYLTLYVPKTFTKHLRIFPVWRSSLWTPFARNKKMESPMFFVPPLVAHKNFGFYSQHVLNKPSAFLSLLFSFPQNHKGGVLLKFFLTKWWVGSSRNWVFLEVTRNKRFELNEYIWKNTIKYYSTHIASFFFKFPSLIFLYLYIIPNKYPTHHYFDSGIELDTVHWILNR